MEEIRTRYSNIPLRRISLQGRECKNDIYVQPLKEICAALGLPEGSVTRHTKAAYGLVQAPWSGISPWMSFYGPLDLRDRSLIPAHGACLTQAMSP